MMISLFLSRYAVMIAVPRGEAEWVEDHDSPPPASAPPSLPLAVAERGHQGPSVQGEGGKITVLFIFICIIFWVQT